MTIADEVLEPGWIATQRLHLIQVGAGAEVLALRPDQNGAHTGVGFLEPVDGGLASRISPESLDPFTVEESASFSPDGKRVIYVHRQREHKDKLCLIDLASKKRTILFESKSDHATEPVFSPNGQQVAFTLGLGQSSQVYVIDVDGKNPHRVTGAKGPNWHPLWIPPPAVSTKR